MRWHLQCRVRFKGRKWPSILFWVKESKERWPTSFAESMKQGSESSNNMTEPIDETVWNPGYGQGEPSLSFLGSSEKHWSRRRRRWKSKASTVRTTAWDHKNQEPGWEVLFHEWRFHPLHCGLVHWQAIVAVVDTMAQASRIFHGYDARPEINPISPLLENTCRKLQWRTRMIRRFEYLLLTLLSNSPFTGFPLRASQTSNRSMIKMRMLVIDEDKAAEENPVLHEFRWVPHWRRWGCVSR